MSSIFRHALRRWARNGTGAGAAAPSVLRPQWDCLEGRTLQAVSGAEVFTETGSNGGGPPATGGTAGNGVGGSGGE